MSVSTPAPRWDVAARGGLHPCFSGRKRGNTFSVENEAGPGCPERDEVLLGQDVHAVLGCPQDRPYPQRCSRLNSPKEGAWAVGSELCEELMLVLPRDMDNGSCPRVPCAAPLSLL